MTGIEAIHHYNGFAMAAVGVTIVFSVLVMLALIISQLHKVLSIWDNRRTYFSKARKTFPSATPAEMEPKTEKETVSIEYVDNLYESARKFRLLIQAIGEPFALPELIRKAEISGIEHPHSKASHLIVNHLIVSDGKGFFRWNPEAFEGLFKGGNA
ncbi:MAG: OadG family protein [Thermodesulfobacteriota bacterium]